MIEYPRETALGAALDRTFAHLETFHERIGLSVTLHQHNPAPTIRRRQSAGDSDEFADGGVVGPFTNKGSATCITSQHFGTAPFRLTKTGQSCG